MRSKRFALLITLVISCLSVIASAQELSIEDKFSKIPSDLARIVYAHAKWVNQSKCDLIGREFKSGALVNTKAYFVTTARGCGWGASKGPIWILNMSSFPPNIIFDGSSYSMKIDSHIHNGWNDLQFSAGAAAWAEISYWVFNGSIYEADAKRTWLFDKGSCGNKKDRLNPENPFDCSDYNQ